MSFDLFALLNQLIQCERGALGLGIISVQSHVSYYLPLPSSQRRPLLYLGTTRYYMSTFAALLQRVQKGLSAIELVYTPYPRWPLPPAPTLAPAPTLRVSVLDSSFNPPTLAHLALASLPPPSPASSGSSPTAPAPDTAVPHHGEDFDARLLLLSVRNADKRLKPGDADRKSVV